MKRCRVQLPQIRITKPGHDVDTASLENHLFHESFLFSQPYYFKFVTCPFAGYVGNTTQTATVQVPVPNVTSNPIVLLYMVSSGAMTVFPGIRSQGAGTNEAGYATESWTIAHNVVSSTRIDVTFEKAPNGLYSPNGAYMVLMRTPT